MAIPAVTNITMRNANVYFGNLAKTNLYQVFITDGWGRSTVKGAEPFTRKLLKDQGVNFDDFGEALGLLCTDASLPASTYATAEVKDNFMGVTQEFAHTRIYTDIDFTFYIDHDYRVLKFFEFWMNYVSGGGIPQATSGQPTVGYHRRLNYPKYYKNSGIYIKKFERDYLQGGKESIGYQFINAFPKSVTSIPISYGPEDLLKITVTMNYDRYLYGREVSPLNSGTNQQQQQQPPSPQEQQQSRPPATSRYNRTQLEILERRGTATGDQQIELNRLRSLDK